MKTNKVKVFALVLAVLITVGLVAWALISEVNYTVNFYYESTELGTYDEPVTVTKKALKGTKVTASDGAKPGFVLNAEAEGTVASVDQVTEGTVLKVYYDRIRVDVKFEYLSKEDVTYKAVYGVGLLNAEGVALTDSLPLLATDAYLNGIKTELTADSFKDLTENALVTFQHTAGDWTYDEGYAPVNFEASYLYAPAVVGSQSFTTTVKLSAMENAVSDTGIAIRSGEEVAVLYITGSGKNLNLILGGVDGSVTGLLPKEATTFVNGACKLAATIKDGMLYISINDIDCGYVAISSVLPSYTAQSEVAIGLYANNAAGGMASFTDVSIVTEGEFNVTATTRWEEKITFVPAASNMKVDFISGTVKFDEGAKSRITFDGNSPAWELSGTINRANMDKILSFGFLIGDGSGKTLELNANNFGIVFGALNNHTDTNYDRYAGHSTSHITAYHKDNKVQKLFTRDGEDTQLQMHFRAMIVDDVFYVGFWFGNNDPTLCWEVPLTETLVYNAKYPSSGTWKNSFQGFEKGSSYTLELFNNGGNPAGSFTNLSVKTGSDVNARHIPKEDKFSFGEGEKTRIPFVGSSPTWELSGTINRANTNKILSFGFLIGDGSGKTLELNAHNIGFVIGGRWAQQADTSYDRYAGHSNGTITDYHLDNVVQRKFTREGEATELQMHFRAMIADDVFYVWFWFGNDNPTLCWRVPLTETLKIREGDTTAWNKPFQGFEKGSSYTLELFNNGGNPAGSFTNLFVKIGSDVDTTQIPIDDVRFGEGEKTRIPFGGSSKAWELSGTINRANTDKILSFGFLIGDGSGKTLELNAHNIGFVIGGRWAQQADTSYDRYAGHSNGTITDYHLDNVVQRKFTREDNGEDTELQMHFRAMIADDVFYVWFWFDNDNPTLCWRVPLTETLKIREGDTTAWNKPFQGFEKGSSYTLELFNNGGNPAGSFTKLFVKTGSAVDTTQIPIDDVRFGEGEKTRIPFGGSSKAWELSGTINRANMDKILSFGFLIGDGSGKTLELNANNFGIVFGALNNHTDTNYDRYAGHSTSLITEYHKENTVQKLFTRDAEDTELQMHFKAMIVDDVFYVWFWFGDNDPTLCWRVPLTETLVYNARYPAGGTWDKSFQGFEKGSSYTLELFNNGGNPAGSFTNLFVKTGSAVDTTQISEVNYTVNFYYESTELGTYDEPVTVTKKALKGTKVTASDGAKPGFVLNAEAEGTVASVDQVTEGTVLKVYYDRIRVDVKFEYLSKEDVTYKAVYGIGLLNAEGVALTDSLPLLATDAYLNGIKTELTADSFKDLTENALVTFQHTAGDWSYDEGYTPVNSKASYLYAPAVVGNQSFTTTVKLSTNAVSDTGIAIRSGEEVAVLYITGSGKNLNLILGGVDGSVTGLLPKEATTFVNGACKLAATIKDGMLYISINDIDCGYVAISSVLPSYTAQSEVAIGLYAKNAAGGMASFTDVSIVTEGEFNVTATTRWEEKITFVPAASNMKVDFISGTVKFDEGAKSRITFDGNSPAWELSGTINRANMDKILSFGFLIGDGSGKTLELNANNFGIVFGALNNHTDTNYDRYAGHSTSHITAYHKENTVQKLFTRDAEDTQLRMHFKAMIADDVFYVWFWFGNNDPTLCWEVPLTETLVYNTQYPAGGTWDKPFQGFEKGSSYTLELFNNGGNPAGSFTNLSVKTGSAVDTTQIPIDDVSFGEGEKTRIPFGGSSKAWELSGTVNRANTDKILSFGFLIGDGSGKTLELNAHNIGFVIGGRWAQTDTSYDRYAGYSNGTITDYHLDNVVQRKFTREGEATELQMHFRAMIVDDMFYVWFWFGDNDPTLCWRVPLTETLKIREGDTTAWNKPFQGFEEGSSYTLELFNNGGNPAGSFTNLSVKTGSAVDTTQIPDVNYTVNFYYESTELGTYDEPVTVTKKALKGTKVTASDGAKPGFVLNAEAEGTVASVDQVTEGTVLKVYYDRIRVDVKFEYLSKEDVTYKAVYGVGLLNAEGVALTDSLPLLATDAYLNGIKTELTADSFKDLTENALVTFQHTAGDWTYDEGYTPVNSKASYLYAPAVVGNQSFTTTVKLSTNAVSDTGIAIRSGEKVAVLYITGSGKNLNLILGGVDGSVTGLLPEKATTFVNGACKLAATIKDGMLYISINDIDCGYVAISSVLPSYTAQSEVAIGLYANNAAGGMASFTDVSVVTEGEFNVTATTRWEEKITFVPAASNMKVDFISGTVKFDEGAKSRITFGGSSKAWELSGTVNRANTDKILSFGFLIGDGSGKTLELNAHNIGFVIGGRWAQQADTSYDRYAGHSNGTITDYHLDNVVQRKFTREDNGEDTELQMHFRAMIADDVFYVWFWFGNNDPTLCWRVPLTETLKIREGDTTAWNKPFQGFEEGSSYTLELFNNGGNPAGSFTNLSVKTGD